MTRASAWLPRGAVLLLPVLATGCMDFSVEHYLAQHPDCCTLTVTKVEPDLGFTATTTLVTVTGTAFEPDTVVTVNGVAAVTEVASPNQLTFAAPASATLGKVDLVLANSYARLTVPAGFEYRPFPFDDPRSLVVTGEFLGAVRAADFDLDGRPDVVVSLDATDRVAVLLNRGAWGFTSIPSPLSRLASRVNELTVGDLNGDGKPDVVAQDCCGTSSVLLGKGDGTFQPALELTSTSSSQGVVDVALGDFNEDGKLDLVSGSDSGMTMLLGRGDGTFRAPVVASAGRAVHQILVADVNGDGHLDAISTRWGIKEGLSQLFVSLGAGDGTFTATSVIDAGAPLESAAVADLDGDHLLDIVVAGPTVMMVLRGQGDGTFIPGARTLLDATQPKLLLRDIDGDGKLDLLITGLIASRNGGVPSMGLAKGNGDGTFRSPTPFRANDLVSYWTTADLDHDGKEDLITTGGQSTLISVLPGR